MVKSSDAFRNIGEVADELGIPKHVLRFWEVKFPQIRPMKRGGGRRYYRPEDVELLRGIRVLLHEEGFTIRGVQKIFREQGADQVKASGEDELAGGMPQPAVVAAAPKTAARLKTRAPSKARQPNETGTRTTRNKSGAGGARGAAVSTIAGGATPDAIQHVAKTVQLAITELKACQSLLLT